MEKVDTDLVRYVVAKAVQRKDAQQFGREVLAPDAVPFRVLAQRQSR